MIDDWIILEEVILSGQVPEEDLQQILLEHPDFADGFDHDPKSASPAATEPRDCQRAVVALNAKANSKTPTWRSPTWGRQRGRQVQARRQPLAEAMRWRLHNDMRHSRYGHGNSKARSDCGPGRIRVRQHPFDRKDADAGMDHVERIADA